MIKRTVVATLPWLGLLSVLAAACALETALASLPLTLAPSTLSSVRISAPRGERVPLTITLRDRSTGAQTLWQCLSDQPPLDDLVVDADALANVAAALCGP